MESVPVPHDCKLQPFHVTGYVISCPSYVLMKPWQQVVDFCFCWAPLDIQSSGHESDQFRTDTARTMAAGGVVPDQAHASFWE